MTIEIQHPELEALIQDRMQTGAFRDVDDLLTQAISALEPPAESVAPAQKAKTLFELAEPLRGLFTDEEIDYLFAREQSFSWPPLPPTLAWPE